MFSPKIVGSDAFLEMPASSRDLYFHFGMYADDDGFISPRKIMRMVGASEDDLKLLIAKKFVIPFDNGVVVMKHWYVNNLVRKDWYQETQYIEQKKSLFITPKNAYTLSPEKGKPLQLGSRQHIVNETETEVRLGKDREGENTDTPRVKGFVRPTVEQVAAYCLERKNTINPQKWFDHYTSNGWKVGRNSMKDWKAAVRTWERSEFDKKSTPANVHKDKKNDDVMSRVQTKKI